MFKHIFISGLLCTFLGAESFDTFLQRAVKSSSYLNAAQTKVEQAKEHASIVTRYKNPSLELEYSDFNPDIGSSKSAYRVNISQPIRLWGIQNQRETYANNIKKSATISYTEKKAHFIRDISLAYTLYAQKTKLVALGSQELEIAKIIYDVSLSRYKVGTISKGSMLQAKIEYKTVQITNENLSLQVIQAYYDLLHIAQINQEISLDNTYQFNVIQTNTIEKNPKLMLLISEQNKTLGKAKLRTNKLEWIDVFAEFEQEPNQNITRFGVNIPLAVFNTKAEENKLAKLKLQSGTLLLNNEKTKLHIKVARHKKERVSLELLKVKNQDILKSEETLLAMFQKGYKIANINLLQLQDIKNRLIGTKKVLIQLETALDQNAIKQNYTQGLYNE